MAHAPPLGHFFTHFETAPLVYPKYLATSDIDFPSWTILTALARSRGIFGFVVYGIRLELAGLGSLGVSKLLGYYGNIDLFLIFRYN